MPNCSFDYKDQAIASKSPGLARPWLGLKAYSRETKGATRTLSLLLLVYVLTIDATASTADAADLLSAMRSCHDRLKGEGIDLGSFTTSASAHDLEDLLLALGYEEWNVWGISYGTTVALTAVRDTPAHVRTITMDSALPVEVFSNARIAADFERSLETLFSGCAQEVSCDAAYPDLAEQLWALVAELNAHPLTFHLPDAETGLPGTVVITGDRLLLVLQQALYISDLIPLLPLMITSTARGDYTWITFAASQVAPGPMAWGLYYAIQCNEEVRFETPEVVEAATAGLREEVKRLGLIYFTGLAADVCAFWDSSSPDESDNAPVTSEVPALILAGEYDPITPPQYGEAVAENLTHSWFFEFPATGHGVLIDRTECSVSIAGQFLSHPGEEPDGSCASAVPPPAFLLP
jgi:pimeloyl-ACP methyl ester carboxylesterase